jgi:hypothetical protein
MADLGWYTDPAGRHELRFFDGIRWTNHVADAGTPSIDPVPRAPDAVVPVRVVDDRRTSTLTERWNRRKGWWATGAIAAVIGLAAATSGDDEGETRVETDAVTTVSVAPASVSSTTVAVVVSEAPTVPPPTVAPTSLAPTTAPSTTRSTTKAPPATFAAVPTAAPEPASDCHPSYRPCVPFAVDVDCAGGSGNGPEYTGRVEIIGPDEYDLDRDHDGIGCE